MSDKRKSTQKMGSFQRNFIQLRPCGQKIEILPACVCGVFTIQQKIGQVCDKKKV